MAKSFLIIDDDSDDRELFKEALTAVDRTVAYEGFDDAAEALKKLAEGHIAQPDLIFLDINMPGMNGWQCLKELKEKQELREIPVIMYTTSGHQRDKDIASDLGALCLITKPASYKLLREKLRMIVQHTLQGNIGLIA